MINNVLFRLDYWKRQFVASERDCMDALSTLDKAYPIRRLSKARIQSPRNIDVAFNSILPRVSKILTLRNCTRSKYDRQLRAFPAWQPPPVQMLGGHRTRKETPSHQRQHGREGQPWPAHLQARLIPMDLADGWLTHVRMPALPDLHGHCLGYIRENTVEPLEADVTPIEDLLQVLRPR